MWELYQSHFSRIPVQGLESRFLIPTLYQLITYQTNPHLAGKYECSLCKKDDGERLFKAHITHMETREYFVNTAAALKSSSDSSGFKKLKTLLGADKKEGLCEICPDSNFTSWMDHILLLTKHKQRLEMILMLCSDIKLAKTVGLMDYIATSNEKFKMSFTWFVRASLEAVPLTKPFQCTLCRRKFNDGGIQYLEHVDTGDHMKEPFLMMRYRMALNEALFWKQVNFAPYSPYRYFCEIHVCPVRKPTGSAVFDPGLLRNTAHPRNTFSTMLSCEVYTCVHMLSA